MASILQTSYSYGTTTLNFHVLSLTQNTTFSIGRALYHTKIPTRSPNSCLSLPLSPAPSPNKRIPSCSWSSFHLYAFQWHPRCCFSPTSRLLETSPTMVIPTTMSLVSDLMYLKTNNSMILTIIMLVSMWILSLLWLCTELDIGLTVIERTMVIGQRFFLMKIWIVEQFIVWIEYLNSQLR